MLNNPSRAWSARKASCVLGVAARHIGLAGCRLEGMPTTGIVPAFASVTRAFSISPESINRTPTLTHDDRTVRTTSQRIAQDSHSQIVGCCAHAKWCAAERRFTLYPAKSSDRRWTVSNRRTKTRRVTSLLVARDCKTTESID
jgi:hypothetical protein